MLLSHGLEKPCAGEDNGLAINGEVMTVLAVNHCFICYLEIVCMYIIIISAFITFEIVINATAQPLSQCLIHHMYVSTLA